MASNSNFTSTDQKTHTPACERDSDGVRQEDGSVLRKKSLWFYLSVVLAVVGFAYLHSYHVSTMFENDRHFSHLSTLEREMSFSTEMGLYYFYFKTLVEAPFFLEGLYDITHNNLTEYPKVINTLKRFNLLPEVAVAGFYRMFMEVTSYFDVTTVKCWHVKLRGNGQRSVVSCEGLGVPVYFYLKAVWLCAGITAALIFLYGFFLSESYVGGLLAIASFFFNHKECTRVQWTPPLRESFAYPFLLLQMLLICKILKSDKDVKMDKKVLFRQVKYVSCVSCLCHLMWQFSSFVMATQMSCITVMYCIGNISRSTFISILASHTSAVATALLLLWGNELLFGSLLTLILALCWMSLLLELHLPITSPWIRRLSSFVAGVPSTFLLFRFRQDILGSRQDTHVFSILLSKVTDYKDFHTLLYTCAPEFDFLPLSSVISMTETGLLPAAITALIFLFIAWTRLLSEKKSPKRQKSTTKKLGKKEKESSSSVFDSFQKLEPHVLYHVLQLIVFMILALLIMRLKLFFTPHLCLTVALLAAKRMVPFVQREEVQRAVIVLLFSLMSFKGIENIQQQRSILGEYSNTPMEEMLTWVNSSTQSNSVFAGPMAVMANLLLSTRRPIVNHPHYEDYELRERTKAVYSIYSNKTPLEVYGILSNLGVDYVVVDLSHCLRSSRRGCTMADLWSVEDPKNVNNPSLCQTLIVGDPSPLKRVFVNQRFVILKLSSKAVEYMPVATAKT